MDIIVGTAGHIDHGKTQLVKALTGTDADRLPEEKSRGITIDLGFAELAVDEMHFGFVDVPGHERFVKNMLAGASGIDLVLFVVAADEGIMPQTREHFDICRLLEIGSGVIAITKSDLADYELIDLVKLDIGELVRGSFLENAPVVVVSAKTGDGLNELKTELVTTAKRIKPRSDDVIARLAIDRSFAVKGFGTVVTGTLASGTISEGDELDLLPTNKTVRVRGVQSHGAKVEQSAAGRRTALNLAGVDYSQVTRGMLLAEKGVLHSSYMFGASVEVLPDAPRPLKTRQRVRLHIGTAEVLARVAVIGESAEIKPGESGFAQLRLESSVAAILGERFILRSYSPQVTIAGGSILRPTEEKIKRRESAKNAAFLSSLAGSIGNHAEIVKVLVDNSGNIGMTPLEIRAITGWRHEVLYTAIQVLGQQDAIVQCESALISKTNLDGLNSQVLATVEQFHKTDPLSKGPPLDILRDTAFKFVRPDVERAVLKLLSNTQRISIENDVVRLSGHTTRLSTPEENVLEHLRRAYTNAGLEVPKLDEALAEASKNAGVNVVSTRKLFQRLVDAGEVVQVTAEFYFSSAAIDSLIEKLRNHANKSADRMIDVPQFKEIAGVSRKFAIPLLEYFDQRKITARRGDKRFII